MYSTRLVQIMMVALSILIATRASWFQRDVDARQLSLSLIDTNASDADESSPAATPTDDPTPTGGDNTDSSTSSTPSPTPTSDESSSSSSTTTTTSSTSSPSTTTTTTTSDSGPITSPPTSTPTGSSSTPDNGNTSDPETTDSTQSTTQTPITRTKTIFYTSTDTSGQTHVGSSESVVVSTPGLSGDSSGSGSSGGGMPASTRDTIIGVTVGVGGAIILAVIGGLYWRLRNKRRTQEESEELISYGAGFGGPGTAEKNEPTIPAVGARSPFQSTLETYHAPTQTNAASNF
ncbi:putative cell wall protein [Rosellinia necatrix]|uniref:Putative cell wall protein n=1 Tax=Rosellinia necatrix TaxID=77044 RepID=A0A1W2TTC5_ROSNE|nr:putative cell wall protein [Rosellinia necatrix]